METALRLARRGALAVRGSNRSHLAAATEGTDPALVFCFGLLHDTRRENEAFDPGHGPRVASFAEQLRDEGALQLERARFTLLTTALRLHSDGQLSSDRTIGTCWDADRLHLPRVGVTPDPALFSTAAPMVGSRCPRRRRCVVKLHPDGTSW